MSAKSDIQLNGSNLCHTELDCQDKNNTLHPETCTDQVLTTHEGSVTLTEWLTYNQTDPTTPLDGFGEYAGLIPWLEHYYPHNSYSLPAATTTTLGGIIVGNNLAIEDGVLSLDATIPTISKASYGTNTASTDYTANGYGTIKLGNDTVISTDFGSGSISYDNSYKFPLRLDSKGRAGIEIDATMFPAQAQSNWEQTDSTRPDYIKGRPTLHTVATTGSYNDLEDKPTIGQVNTGVLTLKYGNTTLGTFSANNESNVTATIPTGLNYLPVETLPTENISTTTIYMLPKSDPATGDYYDEWMYINSGTVEEPEYAWEKIGNTQAVTYTAGSNIQIKNNVISATDTTYTAGNGIDITSNVISQIIATDNTIGGIKTGYVSNDEDLSAVQIVTDSEDSNYKKAFVNISNRSLKNHEVTAIVPSVYYVRDNQTTYTARFDIYRVECKISGEVLNIVNLNDFREPGNGFNTRRYPTVNPETGVLNEDTHTYEWKITSAGANNRIAIINTTSTAAKGCFKLTINHDNGISETHSVGFVIDTSTKAPGDPDENSSCAWFSTCSWAIDARYVTGNNNRIYLVVPSDFTGTISITDKCYITAEGSAMSSMDGSTVVSWTSDNDIIDGSVTAISGTALTEPNTYQGYIVVPDNYKVSADAFVTLTSSPSVGDLLYDSEINDTLIHNLLVRVKSIELWIQSQQQ